MNTKPHKLRTIAAIAIATLLFAPSANASKVGDFFSGIWGIFSTPAGTTATYSNDGGQSVTISKAQAAKLTNLPVEQRSAAVLGILASKYPGSAMGLDSYGLPISPEVAPLQGPAERPVIIPAAVTEIIKTVKPEWSGYVDLAIGLLSGGGIGGIAAFLIDRARRKHKGDSFSQLRDLSTIIKAIKDKSSSGEIKGEIEKQARRDGNADSIHKRVKDIS